MADFEYHALIEFVNRLFTGVVTIAVAMAVLGSLRLIPRRRELVWLSFGLVAGVIAQIILGGLLVKTDLDPRFTMGHFLLSMVLLWNAAVLQHRVSEPPRPTSADGRDHDRFTILIWAVFIASAALLVTGTVVTGSGPHSGSAKPEVASRLPFLVKEVTRLHSITAMIVLALLIAAGITARQRGNAAVLRRAVGLGILLLLQGGLGYLQYFAGVPAMLVAIHIALASITWIAVVRLKLAAT